MSAPDQGRYKTACTGAGNCPEPYHVHGCYADLGNCDNPHDHDWSETAAARRIS